MKLATFGYHGIQLPAVTDVSGKTNLHIDLYAPASLLPVKVALISTTGGPEQAVTVTPTAAGWNSFDIPLASYTTPTLTVIDQIKLDALPNATDAVFIDNLYFW